MVAVGVEQNLKRHSEIAGCLPWICTLLRQPSRRRVSQRVKGYSGTKPCEPDRTLEGRFDRKSRACQQVQISLAASPRVNHLSRGSPFSGSVIFTISR